MRPDDTVTIGLDEYKELLKQAEKLAKVRKMWDGDIYNIPFHAISTILSADECACADSLGIPDGSGETYAINQSCPIHGKKHCPECGCTLGHIEGCTVGQGYAYNSDKQPDTPECIDGRFVGEADHYDMDWVFDKVGDLCNRMKKVEKRLKKHKKEHRDGADRAAENMWNRPLGFNDEA